MHTLSKKEINLTVTQRALHESAEGRDQGLSSPSLAQIEESSMIVKIGATTGTIALSKSFPNNLLQKRHRLNKVSHKETITGLK